MVKKRTSKNMAENSLKLVMYPWFAMGHLTSFLHISNKFAEKGHKIFFILPERTQPRLEKFNLYPNSINFIPIIVPYVEGLPHGTETSSEVTFPLYSLLRHAMDLTEPAIKSLLLELKPDFVFFDFVQWLPALTRRIGIKSIHYCTISPLAVAYLFRDESTLEAFIDPPAGFPTPRIKIYTHEARAVSMINNIKEFGSGMKYVQRMIKSLEDCDAIGFKTCRETEGVYCGFLEKKFKKPVLLAGPVLPKPPSSVLDEKWRKWLDQFEPKTVVFCSFGSEARLEKDRFQELILGIEESGFPFFAALKPPIGKDAIQEALPEGFEERTEKTGFVHGGWVQQQMILSHPSVGCFVTHCGSGSLSEAMVNECQLVLIPQMGDQIMNARFMAEDLRVGVEVEKGEDDGLFTKDGVAKAIRLVMDNDSDVGEQIRASHAKWRDFFLGEGLENSYIDGFVAKLRGLLE